MTASRRDVLATIAGATLATPMLASTATADNHRDAPPEVTLSYDETRIKDYRPSLVLEGVDPRPTAWHALHAESTESDLNAVYGFASYLYQQGNVGRLDSHLGDHEPMIVWYDSTTGDVARVDYSAYHWFRGTATPDALAFADDARHRPVFRVDPDYHHHYVYRGSIPGADVPVRNLLDSIDSWLANGLESELAVSQPRNPYAMLSRSTWWRHNATNWIDATLKAMWFNVGASDARETADVEEVSAW